MTPIPPALPADSTAVARRAAAALQAAAESPPQYLSFVLGGEMLAVGMLNVKVVIEYDHLTESPMMPAFIRGVINLRGTVIPI